MTRTFEHPWWKRPVTVDENGIHELRRGRHFVSIRWDELESLSRDGARSQRGVRISPWLSDNRRREFAECASEMWRQRHPEQWLRNRQRARLKADWAVYFWIPLINIVPITACYIVFWLARWPESWRPKLQQLHRLTALTVIFMIGMMIWYRWKGRKDS